MGAEDGHILDSEVKNCQVKHFQFGGVSLLNPPILQSMKVGLKFHAISSFQSAGGIINANVSGLTTTGSEFNTSPDQFYGYSDYASVTGSTHIAASRLIELLADGHSSFGQYSTGNIPKIQAQLNGCNLVGRRDIDPNKGWEFGVYSVCDSGGGAAAGGDFHSSIGLSIDGCELSGFELDAVYAVANTNTKNVASLSNSRLHSNGQPDSGPVGGNGLHVFSMEGYAAAKDNGSELYGNTQRGFFAHTMGTRLGGTNTAPMGTWIGLSGTDVHSNLGHGIQLAGPYTFLDVGQGGIVGGTIDQFYIGSYSLIVEPGKPFIEDYGIGFVNSATIHDNAGDGVHVWLNHTPFGHRSFASCIFTNCFIWGNSGNGFSIENKVLNDTPFVYFLTPISHCTIAQNQGLSFSTKNISATNDSFFYWTDPAATGGHPILDPKMRIHNSIFEATNSTNPDVDFATSTLLSSIGAFVSYSRIGIGGTRGVDDGGINPLPGPESTKLDSPFAGKLNPALSYPNWLFLQAPGPLTEFTNATPKLLNDLGEVLSDEDFQQAHSRPGFATGDRDKGAHEVY